MWFRLRGLGKNKSNVNEAGVSDDGELIVRPFDHSDPTIKQLTDTTVTNFLGPVSGEQTILTGMYASADRSIAANGDVANKIGTYGLAILCQYHKIPFFVAAPSSTFDLSLETGNKIPLEERSAEEVVKIGNTIVAPSNINVRHPAFDVTPAELIHSIFTEKGVIHSVNRENVCQMIR